MQYSKTTIFVSGQAKPCKEDAINTVYQAFFLSLFVDTQTDCIVNLVCTTAMSETEEFIRQMLCGRNLLTEMDVMTAEIRGRFLALIQKALLVALKDAQNHYLTAFPEKRTGG